MGREDDPLVPPAGKLCHHVVGLALPLPLADCDLDPLRLVADQLHGVRGVDGGAEDLPLLPDHGGPQIPLVDIPIGIVHVAILEEDSPGPGLHQILIGKEAHAAGIQEDDLVLGSGHGDRIGGGHIVELALHGPAAAAEAAPAGDLLPVGQDLRLLDLAHGHGEALNTGRNADGLTPGLQIFRRPKLLRRAAAVDVVGVGKDFLHLLLCHSKTLPSLC